MIRLSDAVIRRIKYRQGKTVDIRFDKDLPGFGVRVFPSGKTAFVLRYADESGRRRLRTVSPCERMTIEEARAEAKRIVAQINRVTKLRREFGIIPTFEALAKRYIESYAKLHRRTWRTDERRLQIHILPELGALPITSIRTIDCVQLHAKITAEKGKPSEANKCIDLVRAIFNKAMTWSLFEGHNPCRGVKKNLERPRKRWVTPDEMPKLMEALSQETSVYARAAVLLYLLTGLRKREILNARWSDIDFQRSVLTISKTKTNEDYFVCLSNAAISVLEQIPRVPGNPYIIVGRHNRKNLVDITKPWHRIRTAAGIEDVHIHDLRHTFGAWMTDAGHNLKLVGEALNHANIRSTQRYSHLQKQTVHAAIEGHGKKLFEFIRSASIIEILALTLTM